MINGMGYKSKTRVYSPNALLSKQRNYEDDGSLSYLFDEACEIVQVFFQLL